MILRAHHLLCTQAYEGKGYSEEFIKNMDKNISILRTVKNYKVTIGKGLDVLCNHCPSNLGTTCKTEEKVNLMDKKVLKYFNLTEDTYIYDDIVKRIKASITKEILDDICSSCEWYQYGICERLILK